MYSSVSFYLINYHLPALIVKTRLPVSSLNPNNSAFYPVEGGLV